MTRSSATPRPTPTAPVALRALRVAATASVVMIVLQGVTAGEILSRSRVAETLHFGGRVRGAPAHRAHGARRLPARAAPPGVVVADRVAVGVFVVSFAQAAFGEAGLLAVHVPLAMLLLVGAVVVMAWSYARPRL